MKRLVVEINTTANSMLEQAREAIIERNARRTLDGKFHELEQATYKSIVERGIAAIHRELTDAI